MNSDKQGPFLSDLDLAVLTDIDRNLKLFLQFVALADRAALHYANGDYQKAFIALSDYHALRQENAENLTI